MTGGRTSAPEKPGAVTSVRDRRLKVTSDWLDARNSYTVTGGFMAVAPGPVLSVGGAVPLKSPLRTMAGSTFPSFIENCSSALISGQRPTKHCR